eukprot:2081640-Rhodomonas_salina.1
MSESIMTALGGRAAEDGAHPGATVKAERERVESRREGSAQRPGGRIRGDAKEKVGCVFLECLQAEKKKETVCHKRQNRRPKYHTRRERRERNGDHHRSDKPPPCCSGPLQTVANFEAPGHGPDRVDVVAVGGGARDEGVAEAFALAEALRGAEAGARHLPPRRRLVELRPNAAREPAVRFVQAAGAVLEPRARGAHRA